MRNVLFGSALLLLFSACVSHTPMSVLASEPLSGSTRQAGRAGLVASGQVLSGAPPLVEMRSPCARMPSEAPPGACDDRPYRGEHVNTLGVGGYATFSDGTDAALSLVLGVGVAGVDVTWWPAERVAVTGAFSAPGVWAGYLTYAPVANHAVTLASGVYVRRRADVYGFDYPSESYAPQLGSRDSNDAGLRVVLRVRDPYGGPAGLLLEGRAGYDWKLGGWALGVSAAFGG
jgi:hypothetical protein